LQWHFGSAHISFVTLFTLLTMNDWSSVYYVNYWGCDKYNGGFYDPSSSYPDWRCDNPKARPKLSMLYFVSFVLIAGIVMLSMFIGTISLAMGESIQQLNLDIQSKKAEKRKNQIARKLARVASRKLTDTGKTEAQKKEHKSVNTINNERLLKSTLLAIMTGTDHPYEQKLERTALRRRVVKVGATAVKIYNSKRFKAMMVVAVVSSGLMIMLGTYKEIASQGSIPHLAKTIDVFANTAFTVEFLVTIASFKTAPWTYFQIPINNFDFIVLMGSFGVLPGGGQFWSLLRLMRLLLILKLARSAPGLRIAVGTLARGAVSISYIAILLLATYFLFGNVAYLLFNENDPFHFRNLHISMVSLFRVSIMDNWIQIMYINMYGCDRYGYFDEDRKHMCVTPLPSPIGSPCFFMFYILIATFVMLNLFIGVVCIAMEESHNEILNEEIEAKKVKAAIVSNRLTPRESAQIKEAYKLINNDGQGGIEATELSEAFTIAGILLSVSELESTLREIGGEDMSIDLAEFVEFITRQKKQTSQNAKDESAFTKAQKRVSTSVKTLDVGSTPPQPEHGTTPPQGDPKNMVKVPSDGSLPPVAPDTKAVMSGVNEAVAALKRVCELMGANEASKVRADVIKNALAHYLKGEVVEAPHHPSHSTAAPGIIGTAKRRRKGTGNLAPVAIAVATAVEVAPSNPGEVTAKSAPSGAQMFVGMAAAVAGPGPSLGPSKELSRAPSVACIVPVPDAMAVDQLAAEPADDAFYRTVLSDEGFPVFSMHESLPPQAIISVGAQGIQVVSLSDGVTEGTLVLALAWDEVAFWMSRQQAISTEGAVVLAMDLLMIATHQREGKSETAGIIGSQSVLKFECEQMAMLRPALERYRLHGAPAAQLAAARESEGALFRRNPMQLAHGPSCFMYPMHNSIAQKALPELPEESALRVCTAGLQVTTQGTSTDQPSVLQSWCWEDIAFWRFLKQQVEVAEETEELEPEPFDMFVCGVRDTTAVGGMVIFRAETEDTDEAHAMLECYCPGLTHFELHTVGTTDTEFQFERIAFEVYTVSPLPAGNFGEIVKETRIRLFVDPQIGVTLYEHEDTNPNAQPRALLRWAWSTLSNWQWATGGCEDAMDLFRVNVDEDHFIVVETEDGALIEACFSAASSQSAGASPSAASSAKAAQRVMI
jgi:voltage-gated sodium channel